MDELTRFQWKPCPEGQAVVDGLIQGMADSFPQMQSLSHALTERTGTRLFDWIDHLAVPETEALVKQLHHAGFGETSQSGLSIWEHPGALFPRILPGEEEQFVLALKVESVADFLAANQIETEIQGEPLARLRKACAWRHQNREIQVVERHGWRGFDDPPFDAETAISGQRFLERFRSRRRNFGTDDDAAFAAVHALLEDAIAVLGQDWTADLWFAAERDFWMLRNRAARFQKARQDQLGLGWANHDHHTYRCRRKTFHHVIAVFEALGFTLRERFYAGAEAGWGAQIVEHQSTGITIFADVDMSPEEVTGDFAHQGLPETGKFGTVGLWCELHGESMFEAGMHHLEAQFDFDALREQMLAEAGIPMMKPFTDLANLRQQFTEGERWAVAEDRLERLLQSEALTPEEADQFRENGAVGSHLENLERNGGYKGFNQTGISDIIARTDPRQLVGQS